MSAITTSSDSTCPSHQESAWGAAEARQERVIVEVVSKAIIAGNVLFYLLNTSTKVFYQYCPRREDVGRGAVLRSIYLVFWRSPTTNTGQEKDN